MTTEAVLERPRLPVWRTVGQAYMLWARNLPDLVRACWLWLLLLTPFVAIESWWRAPQSAALLKAARQVQPFADPTPLLSAAGLILLLIAIIPAAASIAVAWHRLVLRNAHPGPGVYLRFDSVVVGYVLLLAVIWLPGRGFGLLMPLIGRAGASWIVVVALTLAYLFVVPRISLALPATALGRNDVGFGRAWQATAQNTWRMFWASFICLLPLAVISDVTMRFLPSDPSRNTMTLFNAALDLLTIPLGLIEVGMLSLAYRHFFERDE